MAAPAGYTELGRIGFVDRGTYASGTTYRIGDVVYYNGSTWSALKDNLQGVTPAAGANWKYMARGFAAEALSAITANDTSGVLGTAGASVTSQELIDAIADKVMTKLIEKSKIVNNLLATDATTVLSGPMGKSLDEKITKLNSDLAGKLDSSVITAQYNKLQIGNVKIQFGALECGVNFNGQASLVFPEGYSGESLYRCMAVPMSGSYAVRSITNSGNNNSLALLFDSNDIKPEYQSKIWMQYIVIGT
ncbi:hypothetical protein [Hungatella sp. SB206]|uniref:hypothetical protein n=1 Tax=Hungatella sp. SB206 TaxID=2937758 RepID=UPI003DA8C801